MEPWTKEEIDAALPEFVARWLEIAKGRETCGSGTSAEQSTRYQMERLLPLTARRCRLYLDASLREPIDGLVSLVGMSPQTTIMVSEALRPRNLLLVASTGVEGSVQAIDAWMRDPARDWPSPSIETALVPPTDSDRTARAVRTWIEARRAAAPGGRIIFDATGGKKSMSVVAGMLAVQLGLEVAYLDSTFDPSLRMPRPGSESIVLIPVPR